MLSSLLKLPGVSYYLNLLPHRKNNTRLKVLEGEKDKERLHFYHPEQVIKTYQIY